jgi:hypothetical protein
VEGLVDAGKLFPALAAKKKVVAKSIYSSDWQDCTG